MTHDRGRAQTGEPSQPTLIRAAWVAPMTGPVMRDAAVVFVDGRIIAVGDAAELARRYPRARAIDAGKSILVPGLVNAHTHLELSDCIPGPRPPSLGAWLTDRVRATAAAGDDLPAIVANAIAIGVGQCLRFGVTSVGDISKHCHLTRPLLATSPLRVTSYGEVMALAARRSLLQQRLAAAIEAACATDRLRIGLTPHAPYTVEPFAYRRCLEMARAAHLPLATHLAESSDEAPFLADHSGPFRDLWSFINAWDDDVPRFSGGPIRLAKSLGLLDYPTLLAHVNYVSDAELDLLAAGRASVVYCPRTHEYFGHPPHRLREMLARGINVAIGTDSCASSDDLNLMADLRLARTQFPELSTLELFELITRRAAHAIDAPRAGRLAVDCAADFTLFPAEGARPLDELLRESVLPSEVWIAGATEARAGAASTPRCV